MRYEASAIVNKQHQSCATKLVIGERMIPHVFVQAADIRAVNIHDVIPSDTRFKVLVFVGNVAVAETMARVRALADKLDAPNSFLHRYGQGDYHKVFDILCICAARKDEVDFIGMGFAVQWYLSGSHCFRRLAEDDQATLV